MQISDEKEITKYIKSRFDIEVNLVPDNEALSASILELRKGKEIWQYFLIVAIIFLIIEILISRSFFKSA